MNYPETWTTGGEVTILIADEPVAKTWRGAESTAYPDVYRWRVRQINVDDLDDLAAQIERAAEFRRACIIRGFPLEKSGSGGKVRRLVRQCQRTGDPPTFASAPAGLHWICVDVDGVPTDRDPATDPDGYAESARRVLPAELASGRCFYQLSASAGVKPGARVHLWYWLERRALDDALRTWANGVEHIDASLFGAVQPHYVAAPLFIGPHPEGWGEAELPDPLPRRTGFLDGTPEVWPAGLMGVEKWQAHQEQEREAREVARIARSYAAPRSIQGARSRAEGAIASSVAEIESAGAGGRNAAICRRANFLGRVASTGAITLDEARRALELAAQNALAAEWSSRGRTTLDAIARCLQTGFSEGSTE